MHVRFLAAHTIGFAAIVALLYLLLPQFLVQNHDGHNLFYLADKYWIWRDSHVSPHVFAPLSGSGATLWPLNPSFIPFLWPFAWFQDATVRVFLLSLLASITIFVATLAFFTSLRIRPGMGVAAAWFSFTTFMLQTVDFMTGTDPIVAIAYAYLAVAALIESGRRPTIEGNLGWGLLCVAFSSLMAISHPGWHLLGLPFVGSAAAFFALTASQLQERIWKVSVVASAALLHAAIGTYGSLLASVGDTARVLSASSFEAYAQTPYLAGHLFRTSWTEILWGMLLIAGLVSGNLAAVSSRPEIAGATTLYARLLYGTVVATSLVFLYGGVSWQLPKPSYVLLFAYPISALFAVLGIVQVVRSADWAQARHRAILLTMLSLFLGWHVWNGPHSWTGWASAIACAGIGLILARRHPALCLVLVVAPLIYAFDRNVAALLGGGPDRRRSGIERMGLVPTPVVAFLHQRIGLRPGDAFRGYAEDAYARRQDSRTIIDDVIGTWAHNWATYGSGQKLFAWSIFDIPTLTQYSPYIRPAYFALFSGLLNKPSDVHVVNYISVSNPNVRILRLMGVRYLVTDHQGISDPGIRQVFTWERFRIFEIPDANLGHFSPVELRMASSVPEAINVLQNPEFDVQRSAVVHEPINATGLVQADLSNIVFDRGGYTATLSSASRSVVVLPVQFSHCLIPEVISGNKDVRVFRVNVAQTGVSFVGRVTLRMRFADWPFEITNCQTHDRDASRELVRKKTPRS